MRGAIIKFLKDVPDAGVMLLITWQAFVDLPFFPQRELWTIIIDEVPQIDHFYRVTVPLNYGYLTEHLELLPTEHAGCSNGDLTADLHHAAAREIESIAHMRRIS